MAGRADRETPIDIKSFLAGEADIVKVKDRLVVIEKKAKSEEPTETEKPQKVEKVTNEEISETEKVEKGGIDNLNKIEKLKDEIVDVQARIEVGGKGNNKNRLTKKLKDLREKVALLEIEKKKNEGKDDYWAKRSKFQGDSIKESRNAVIEKKKARESAQKNTSEAKPQDGAGEIVSKLEKEKASLKEDLAILNSVFEESKKRDPDLDNYEEAKIRGKIAYKMQKNKNRISEIDKEINPLTSKNMTRKNMGETSFEDAYKNQFKEEQSNLYDDVNKKHELEAEQENAKEVYKSDFKDREKTSESEKGNWEKLREKDDAEKEKRAAELKEKEEFTESYKRQFGEEEESREDVKKTEIVDTTIADSEKVDSGGQLKAKIDKLKNLPEDAKDILREKMMDDEVKRIEDEHLMETLKSENAKPKEDIENAKKVESKLAAMENALKEKIEELTVKDATKLDKFKKFITNPKVKLAIGIGLIGVASVATGGGALVGAWLHLPYGLGISALGGTSNLTTALLGSGLVGRAYGDKIKNGFRENMKEILGIIKNEEKTSIQKSAEDGKNAGSEQRPADEIVAETHPETLAKETEDIKDKTRKDDKIDVIEGSGSEELTLEEKEKMRKIAKGNKIDIISPGAEVKDDGELIKKTERMKKPVPETEDKFNKKAEDVRTFIGQLKEGKKTGKEIFEYLENLRHHFLYSSKVNFNSKIKPEFDKLSREEKTDTIDLTVEYFMSQEQHKGEFLRRPFIFDLDDIIYGKDFSEFDYVIRGKPKNVEWLFKKENKK